MPIPFQDYYQTLGVARDATQDEIKDAFRALARRHHPDVAKNKVAGEARFKEINEAYQILGDPTERTRYDQLEREHRDGSSATHQSTSYSRKTDGEPDFAFHGTGFSEFYEAFFGRGRHPAEAWAGSQSYVNEEDGELQQRGRDTEADLLVTLKEALRGSLRRISLQHAASASAPKKVEVYEVKIPAGVREGQRIRLATLGGSGQGGGPSGDLFLRIRLAQHPDLRVEGSDLHFELLLSPWEAALGAKVQIPALDGPTTLVIPPGTTGASALRLRGLGMPAHKEHRGDLYVHLQIRVASRTTPEEEKLWTKLAQVSPFKARASE